MSGIAGIFHLTGRPAGPLALTRMTEALAHRGPDGAAHWCEGAVALGHRMLCTTPESLHEALPLTDRTGRFTITADARIDNRDVLLKQLDVRENGGGVVTDSALVLAAYKKWGADCPEKLLGAFAFAIWDERRHRLFCARDHSGVKPFFYYHDPGRLFAFASEIKALFYLDDVPQVLNEVRVAQHLMMPVREDVTETFYEDIRSLAPAHASLVRPDGWQERRYWRLDPQREIRLGSDEEYAEALREIFVEAVRCRLRSAYPVGSMLSGGLDSSSITCAAARVRASEGGSYGTGPLHTFSAIFEEVTECDERSFIDTVLDRHDNLQPHYFTADQASPLAGIEGWLRQLDRAIEAGNLYINWNLYEAAHRQGTRVVLDGFDGDTTLSHGRRYLVELANRGRWLTLASEAKAYAQRMGQPWKPVVWAWLKQYGVDPAVSRHRPLRLMRRGWRGLARRVRPPAKSDGASPVDRHSWRRTLHPRFVAALEAQREPPPAPPATEREHHHRLLTRALMPQVLKLLDGAAAACQVELRVPFFDKRLIEFCLALPPEQKMHDGWTRLVMRRAMKGLLPEKIRWRPGKSNIGPSFDHGLLTYEQERLADMVHHDTGNVGRYVNLPVLREAYRHFAAGEIEGGEALMLWRALSLALWLQQADFSGVPEGSADRRSRKAAGLV